MSGSIECGWCGQHFPYTTADELLAALRTIECDHKEGDDLCQAVGGNTEHYVRGDNDDTVVGLRFQDYTIDEFGQFHPVVAVEAS